MDKIRILVVSDKFDTMHGLSALLKMEGDFHIVGEVKSNKMALHMMDALNPDVLLLDSGDIVNTIEAMRWTAPHTQIIAFSDRSTEVRAAGAFACLLPNFLDPTNISNTIRRACANDAIV